MSEVKAMPAGQTTISVDQLISLKSELNTKQERIGELKALLAEAKEAKDEAEYKMKIRQKKNEINKPKINLTSDWDSAIPTLTISNFEDIPEAMEKTLKAYEDYVNKEGSLLHTLKETEKEVKDLEQRLKDKEEDYVRSLRRIRREHSLEIENIHQSNNDLLNDKDVKIKALKKELKDLKENKTDELIEANRKQEISDLKAYIKKLETKVETELLKPKKFINWDVLFGRTTDENKVEAEKELLRDKEVAEKVSKEYPKKKSFWSYINYGWHKVTDPFRSSTSVYAESASYDPCEYDDELDW